MSHLETLIFVEVRKALDHLQKHGIGFVTDIVDGKLYYDIDGTVITVEVGTEEKGE